MVQILINKKKNYKIFATNETYKLISPVAQFAVELKSSAQPAKEVSLKRSIWKPAEFMPFMNAQLCLVARHDVTLDSVQNTNTKKQ